MIAYAAIKYPNGEVLGFHIKAKSHSHVIGVAARRGWKTREADGCVQGFVTENNVFMTRAEAKEHAIRVGQLHPSHNGTLYSEDLWTSDQIRKAGDAIQA